MANLTTADGLVFLFDPSAITMVADRDADTGALGTNIYGLQAGPLKTAGTVDTFLSGIGLLANFAPLTRPNGSPVWVNAKAVNVVRQPLRSVSMRLEQLGSKV
jgi:hypothetical protein